MSFHEKSAWACLIALLLVFVPYFLYVFQFPMAFVGLFILAIVVLVALLVAFHVVNAMLTPSIRVTGDEPSLDERDAEIETWSAKVSGCVLGFLVLVWCLNAMFGIPVAAAINASESATSSVGNAPANFSIPAMQALMWVHLLFAAFVVANLTYYSMIIFSYRRSA